MKWKCVVCGVKMFACGFSWWLLFVICVSSAPTLRICMFLLRYVLIRWLGLAFINDLSSPSIVIRASFGVASMSAYWQSIIYLSVNEKMKSYVVLLSKVSS